jgi:hypothetical protein
MCQILVELSVIVLIAVSGSYEAVGAGGAVRAGVPGLLRDDLPEHPVVLA